MPSSLARKSGRIDALGLMVAIFLIARLIYAPLGEKQSSTPLAEILVVFVGLAAPFGVRALARSGRGVSFLVCFIASASVLLASSYLHPDRKRVVWGKSV